MNRFEHQWQKLIALARSAPTDPAAMPFGFATRVAAQAAALPAGTPWRSIERFAFRGLLVAGACSVAAVVFNYSVPSSDQTDLYATGTTDAVVDLLDIS
jgi:hypothetical protein